MYPPEEVSDFDTKPRPQATQCEVVDEATETAPQGAIPAEAVEVPVEAETPAEVPETAEDEDEKNFLASMKKMATKNLKVYVEALGHLGYESAKEVPAERRQYTTP